MGTTRTGAGGVSVGGGNAGASRQAPTARPAPAPATTKVAPAPAPTAGKVAPTPAPTAGKVAPTPAGGSALDRATAAASKPPAFSPKPQSDVGAMIARSQARQAAQTPKPATPAPAARPMGGARERMLQRQSFDVFDVIKGHLIDEGYADTEESALVIMANMSEEWRQSIVEAIEIPRPRPTKYIAPSRPLPATTRKPDMSTPKDREIGRRISQTPIGVRLTGPTGPIR